MKPFDDILEEARRLPRPNIGAKVERDKVPPDGRTVPGVVLAVVDDDRALGGWVALVRWWLEHRRVWDWQAYRAIDFVSIGQNVRGEDVPAKVRLRERRKKENGS